MYWLLYDISSTKKRLKLIQLCKDYGLFRIQKSCFFGNLNKMSVKVFEQSIQALVEEKDCVCLIPINQTSFQQIKIWGTPQQTLPAEKECCCFI